MQEKKVMIFLGSLTSGGAERVASVLSKYLVDQTNFKVVVVTLDGTERDFYTLDNRVKRVAMDIAHETKGFGKYFSNIKRVASFRKVVKEENPDIILVMMTRYAVIALIATIFSNIRVIVSERNYPGKRKNHRMWDVLRKYTYRFADLHVVQTKKIAVWLERNTSSNNFKIVPNSISWPLPNYEPTLEPSDYLDDKEKLILAVGTIKDQKGFDLLINAAKDILPSYPDWKLIIIGEEKKDSTKKLRQKLEGMIVQSGLSEQILMPGRAGNIGVWYNRADIFVLSSRFEGFPNVLLEAMSSGCACISFECDTGPSDMIDNYKNGILVPDGDIKEMETALKFLIQHPGNRQEFGREAKKLKKKYSEKNIMKQWVEILKSFF